MTILCFYVILSKKNKKINIMDFELNNLLYEGKAKQIYATEDPGVVVVHYKDDASAYNGIKRAQITNKGILNNKISSIIYAQLADAGVKTHFIQRLDDRNQLCHKVDVIPIEFIVHKRRAIEPAA